MELSALQTMIKGRIGMVDQWVKVEIESYQQSRGHHYLGLIQKGSDGNIVARARGTIWASRTGIVNVFQKVTGQSLKTGLSIVVHAVVDYHPVFGLSLNIVEINCDFSVGQRELEKRASIEKLRKEGLIDRQKSLSLPFLPSRIAIISSSTAAGYGDFIKHLADNSRGYVFDCTLFDSLMQGDSAPSSMIDSLDMVVASNSYDLILIFRGGGAEYDMYCFDDYCLARKIALCPVPVLTAIGHERDYHIADMVAYEYCKTPTALSDFLVQWVDEVESGVQSALSGIADALDRRLEYADREVSACLDRVRYSLVEKVSGLDMLVSSTASSILTSCMDRITGNELSVQNAVGRIHSAAASVVSKAESELVRSVSTIQFAFTAIVNSFDSRVALSEAGINAGDPRAILRQGYVLALDSSGTVLKNVGSRGVGDKFSLRFCDGLWKCAVDEVIK